MSVFSPFSSKRRTPLGIACGVDGYRCVQLDLSGPGGVLVAKLAESNPATLKHVARTMAGGQCVVAPLPEDLVIRPARMPLLEGEEFRDAARWEAAQMLECHAEDLVAEAMVVSEEPCDDGRLDVLIVALRQERITQLLEPLLVAGLRPVAVEPSFLAAGRAFALRTRRREDAPIARAVIEITREGSNLIVMSGDRSVFAKRLTVGGEQFDDAVASRLGVTQEEARLLRHDSQSNTLDAACVRSIQDALRRPSEELANELAMSLRYVAVAARIGSVEAIHLCGGEATVHGLDTAITTVCSGLKVAGETTTDSWLARIQERGGGAASDWTVALGLAMRPAKGQSRRRAA